MSSPPTITLQQLAEHARESGSFALDTEFVGERRYWPLLCLVQFAVETPDGVAVTTVDPLEDHDQAPILDAIADPEIEIVVHAGAQDLILIRRAWGVQPTNLFDTQVAAAFAGSSIQISYKAALQKYLGLKPPQSEGFTHWDRRPLTAKQIEYAQEDVEHLPALARALRDQLTESGRLEWAREESRNLESLPDRRDPLDTFARLSQGGKVRGAEVVALRELVIWREQTAEQDDRPVRSVLTDQALTQLARKRPQSIGDFKHIRGVHEGVPRRYGKQILSVLRRAEEMPPVQVDARVRPPDAAEPLVSLSQTFIRARTLEQGLAAPLIASSSEINDVVVAILQGDPEPSNRLTTGWRRELVGEELVQLLKGNRSIAVGEGGRLIVSPRSSG